MSLEKPEYWPGTTIVKSSGNGFTRSGPSCMSTPAEAKRAQALDREAKKLQSRLISKSGGIKLTRQQRA